ncbi:MAG TPA: hypothetical protein VHX44_01155 [Planctomycetota bacterium]|nr:hypothetical protein [Planctomycetota bacterium]
MTNAPAKPTTSRITLLAASLAAPMALLATWAIAFLIGALGLVKLLPSTDGNEPASVTLLRLSTGGVVDSPWGQYLVGALQIALGLGLLFARSRALAGIGYLLYAIAVVIGVVVHWSALVANGSLNATGIALIFLVVVLLAGAALGTRGAAKRLGAAA